MAKDASFQQVRSWYGEANREKGNAKASFGFLVTQRAGVGYPRAGEWWAYGTLGDLAKLRYGIGISDDTLVRVTLADLVRLIHG